MNEYHIYGPPGCGKTTTAAKNIRSAVKKYGADKVMVCSHTRAAAHEIAMRGIDVKKSMVGTLHSLCFHALGKPEIAELHIKEFNEEHPAFAVTSIKGDVDDPLYESMGEGGNNLFSMYQLNRSKQVNRLVWTPQVKIFAKMWEDFKERTGRFDFNDLLEIGYSLDYAPGEPAVGFVDEAQDFSALQFGLVRKWAERMDWLVLLGDDDQSIYGFAGADPRNLIDRKIAPAHRTILKQSYRLPGAVYDYSTSWIARASHRMPKTFAPRGTPGKVEKLTRASYAETEPLIRDMLEKLDAGKRIMVLASCSYMLKPIIEEMRNKGLLFHNPYRKKNGAWNPWRTGGTSTSARISAFLKCDEEGLNPFWTAKELKLWTDIVKSKNTLQSGAREKITALAESSPNLVMGWNEMRDLLIPTGPWADIEPWSPTKKLLDWFSSNIKSSHRDALTYVRAVLEREPLASMSVRQPNIIVGTIHSVKGGETDCVYLFPDISWSAANELDKRGSETRDAMIRLFYVGMTRARETLVICGNAGRYHVGLR